MPCKLYHNYLTISLTLAFDYSNLLIISISSQINVVRFAANLNFNTHIEVRRTLDPPEMPLLVREQNNWAKINTQDNDGGMCVCVCRGTVKTCGWGSWPSFGTIGQLDKLWRSAQMEFAVASIIVA